MKSSHSYAIKFRNIAGVCLVGVILYVGAAAQVASVKARRADEARQKAVADAIAATNHVTTDSSKGQWKVSLTGKKREYSVTQNTNGLKFNVQSKH